MKTLLLISIFSSFSALAQGVTKIESFTPVGEISQAETVHVKFSEFMFQLGGSASEADPFTTSCANFGKGRWLNPKEWVFNFTSALPPKTQCDFKIKDGLKSQKGIPLVETPLYSFTVVAATLQQTEPEGVQQVHYLERAPGQIDPDQNFVFHFSGKITNEEIAERFYFTVEGQKEEIGLKVEDPKILKILSQDARIYIDRSKDAVYAVVTPKLNFPNQENLLLTLRDRKSSTVFFYKTRPFFKAEFTCNRDNVRAPCSPIQTIDVIFNSPVSAEDIKRVKITGPSTFQGAIGDSPNTHYSHEEHALFKGPFKAGATYHVEVPKDLKDIRGRSLKNASSFPLEFKTDSLPSVAKFPGSFGVVEASNPLLPLSVRNIEKSLEIKSAEVVQFSAPEHAPQILNWLDRVEKQGNRYGENKKGNPKASNYESVLTNFSSEVSGKISRTNLPTEGIKNQAEVVGIPLNKKGLQIVEVQSKVLGKRILDRETPLFASTAALLTNLGIHFKWGQQGPSLIWVTELSSGKPVKDVAIKIEACNGKLLASGTTLDDGTLTLEKLPTEEEVSRQYACNYENYHGTKLVVLAKKDDDFSFLLNSWDQGIEAWRFNLPHTGSWNRDSFANISAHTVLARDYLKPGQKLNLKHYFREFHYQGFQVPKKLPKYAVIQHLGSGQSWNLPIKFNAQGIANHDWLVPENANLGDYTVSLSYELPNEKHRGHQDLKQTGSFSVQEFRLPTLNVTMNIPDPITTETKAPKIALQGKYLSGGPSSHLPVEIRFQRKPVENHSRKLGDYIVAQDEPIQVGIHDKKESEADEPSEEEMSESDTASRPSQRSELLTSKLSQKLNLDEGGSAYVDLPKEVLSTDQDAEVQVALSYTDPNGEIQTSVRGTSIFSRDRYLAIQKDTRSYQENPNAVSLDLMLASVQGKAAPGEPISVDLYQQIDYVHRSRLVGGFYGYHTTTEIKKLGEFCSGKTNGGGRLICNGKTPGPGEYQLQVNAKDSQGKKLTLIQSISIYGSEEGMAYSDSDRLTLVPDREEYGSGGTAEITVQAPFQKFTALVTLERGGVVDHFIKELSGSKPVISIPIQAAFSPNIVISVLAVRGRVADPEPTGLLDLAKPAFRLGMTMISVGRESHSLPIKVTTDKTVYQVRETAKVSIETKPNAEIALAVIDQALLKLHPNKTWNLLDKMIVTQNHAVNTSTLQMNLIGKRHFGKKATPFGGGGGNGITRELLDSLVTWVPNLKVGPSGKLETKVKLNDSISSFTVVAIGTEGLNLYGTGKAEIAATQDLQIISSVPPTLRENDHLPLQFIFRNTTFQVQHVNASLKVGEQSLPEQKIELAPQTSKELRWDYTVPKGVRSLAITASATSSEGPKDALKTTSKVVEVTPVYTIDGYLTQLKAGSQNLPVQFPKDALTDKGGYRIALQARLSEVPNSLTQYLRDYPFGCFEQQTSKAIGLNDPIAFKKTISNAKAYLDSNSLLKFFPSMRYGSVDLTAYVLLISAEAAKMNPGFKLSTEGKEGALLTRLIQSLKKGMRGEIHVSQSWWPDYVNANERIAAAEAIAEYEAIPLADYESLKSVADLKNPSHLLSLIHILKLSESSLKNSLSDLTRYQQELNSQFEFENTHLFLKNARFWFYGSLSASPDALKDRVLLHFVNENQIDEASKMLRTTVEAMKHGALDTTPADAWAVVAFSQFKKRFENSAVSGVVTASIGSLTQKLSITEKTSKTEAFLPIHGAKDAHELNQTYAGTGSPWSFTLVEAAIPITTEIDHGFLVRKTIEPLQASEKGKVKPGDLYRVHLKFESKAAQSWVVVTDPIPTGASILETESKNSWIAFEERRMDRMQIFFEYLAPGTSEFTYTVRINQAGEFEFPPTRIEAMYDPTQYGEAPNAKMVVNP